MEVPETMRKVAVSVVSVVLAGSIAAAAISACGGNTSSGNSPQDGGSEGGIIRRMDGGVGDNGDTGVAVVVPPTGSLVLNVPAAYLEGVTDDGYAVYQDTTSNALYAVSITTPNPTPKTITTTGTDYLAGVFVEGNVVLMLSGTTSDSKVGQLKTWTSTTGTKVISARSTLALVDVSNDSAWIAFYDNANEVFGSLTTGDLAVSKIDGTSKTVLAPGVRLQGGDCNLLGAQASFVGSSLFALSCTPASDAGAPPIVEAGAMTDAGDGGLTVEDDAGDGGAPLGPPLTITMYSGASWAATPIDTNVQSTGFVANRANGMPGTEILFASGSNWVVYPVPSGPESNVAPNAVSAGLSTDGTRTLYITPVGDVFDTPVSSPSSAVMLTNGAFTNIMAGSPDAKSKFALLATKVVTDPQTSAISSSDLNLISTTGPSTAVQLSMTDTAALYGQGFTQDSNWAVFDDNALGYVGTLTVAPTTGTGTPVALGTKSWIDSEPTGSLVIFNVNCGNCSTMYVPGTADIQYVDLSKGMTPTTIVTQADYYYYLTKDKTKVVYTWHPTSPGAPTSQAGVWVWNLP
jgi:hypothetical protein